MRLHQDNIVANYVGNCDAHSAINIAFRKVLRGIAWENQAMMKTFMS